MKSNPRLGFIFNLRRTSLLENDSEAEFDSPETIKAIHQVLVSLGYEVLDVEADSNLVEKLLLSKIDFAFNISERFRGKARRAEVPLLLEMLNIPYTGSDPTTHIMTTDKVLAKRTIHANSILTPHFFEMIADQTNPPEEMKYPLIVKLSSEGSSKGLTETNIVNNKADFREISRMMIKKYKQPLIIEEYIYGREFTVGLLGNENPYAFPIMEIVFQGDSKKWVYSYFHKLNPSRKIRYQVPADINKNLYEKLTKIALTCFSILGCRDIARMDFRVDEKENIYFLECNPLPGLTPGWSDLYLMAKANGMDYHTLIKKILYTAFERYTIKNLRFTF